MLVLASIEFRNHPVVQMNLDIKIIGRSIEILFEDRRGNYSTRTEPMFTV